MIVIRNYRGVISMKELLIFITLLFAWIPACFSQLSLPKMFGNSMVLQRDILIPVWGNATPGATVIASLGNIKAATKADAKGKWILRFPRFKAGGPYTLKITEQGKPATNIVLKDILIGDVWLASGQSNMEFQVQQSKDTNTAIANANYPKLRFLLAEHDIKLSPQTDIQTKGWKICDTNNVKEFSAVAYFFAHKIHSDQNVPVGIIQSTWGGTPVEAWTSREMLLTSPISKAKTLSNDTLSLNANISVTDSLNWAQIWNIVYNPQNNTDITVPNIQYRDADWPTVEMPNLIKDFGIGYYEGMVWLRKKIELPDSFNQRDLTISLGHPEMNYSLYFNGVEICRNIWNSNATHSYTIPVQLVQREENTIAVRIAMLWGGGGLNPPSDDLYITDGTSKISLAGKWLFKKDLEPTFPKVLNYQYYPTVLFNAMINPIIPYGIKGFIWYQGESNAGAAYDYRKLFPMLITDWRQRWQHGNLPFLFVQLANYMKTKPLPAESEWAELREAQMRTLTLPNTGMACTIDVGEANDIHPKKKQEVGHRLALIAGKMVYKQNIIASGPVYNKYRKEGNTIRISFTNIRSGLSTKDGKEVTGFAVAGKDQKFYWAKATIKGNDVIVSCDKVGEPVAARYAWADNPECNLVNNEGLPAIPFRTDTWKGITQK
jgi:sialate O-acetylesterase